MLNSKARRGRPNLSEGEKRPREIMALIGLSGAIKGTVALSFPEKTAMRITSSMLMMEIEEIDSTVTDTIAETVNIVSGYAKAKLSEQVGSTLDLSLPTVIKGDKYRVYTPSKTIWLELPFESDLGNFLLRITFDATIE